MMWAIQVNWKYMTLNWGECLNMTLKTETKNIGDKILARCMTETYQQDEQ